MAASRTLHLHFPRVWRRPEVVRLNVGDYQSQFGLRRARKGGHETTVPLSDVARAIVTDYLGKERPGAAPSEPLFQVQYT